MDKRNFVTATFALAGLAAMGPAFAQASWPTKPVTLITAGAPGDGLDVITRIFADRISKILGQPVLVDNRPGAGGRLAMNAIKMAQPDGYTMGAMSLNNIPLAAVNAKNSYDPVNDFTPISLWCDATPMLVINPALPVKNVQEFVAYAKANPGKLNYGSSGVGSIFHFYGEWFSQLTGINSTHVPYKGEALAINDIVSGRVQYMFASGVSKPFVNTGRLTLLATAGPERMGEFPNIPTMAESGISDFSITGWIGMVGPVGVSSDIVKKLNAATVASTRNEDVKKSLAIFTFVPGGSTPEEFAKKIRLDMTRLGKIGQASNIQLE